MAKINYLGNFLDYDLETNQLLIQLSFISLEDQAVLEQCVFNKLDHTFNHKPFLKTNVSAQQQRCWYGSLRTIVLKAEILPNAETLRAFDIQMRKAHFPFNTVDLGELVVGGSVIEPKQMRGMSHEEMGRAIESLHSVYDHIDWSDFIQK